MITPLTLSPILESTIPFIEPYSHREKYFGGLYEDKELGVYSFANSSIVINNSISNSVDSNLKASKRVEYNHKLMEIKNLDYRAEGFEPPSEKVFQESISLIDQLIEKNFFPNRISESVEGGLCYYFYKDTKILYFEVYNDGEKGYIIEDTSKKKILKNYDISSYDEIFNELENFFV